MFRSKYSFRYRIQRFIFCLGGYSTVDCSRIINKKSRYVNCLLFRRCSPGNRYSPRIYALFSADKLLTINLTYYSHDRSSSSSTITTRLHVNRPFFISATVVLHFTLGVFFEGDGERSRRSNRSYDVNEMQKYARVPQNCRRFVF